MLRIFLCTICFLFSSIITLSQNGGGGTLEVILDSEGKVKSGVNGSFDASGYSLILADRGSPRFLQSPKPASPASVAYSSIGNTYGAVTGSSANIKCVVVKDDDIYIGGNFAVAGKAVVNGIARWHEGEWISLGSGFNGNVFTMVFIGSDLYAGGFFTKAGDITVNNIAKWNGSEWSALSSGVNSAVNSLATDGVNLFAGGNFTLASGLGASYIAKWNGSLWSRLGSGASHQVFSVYYYDNILYIGGYFTSTGGVAASKIAFWDGLVWAQVGTGILGSGSTVVNSIVVYDGIIYAGGTFSVADGNLSANLMGWNGTEWIALGTGINASCHSLYSDGSYLYAGGSFSYAGGLLSSRAARWNGTAWSSMGTELTFTVTGLFCSGGTVFLVGTFPQNLALWNGSFSFEPAPHLDINGSAASVTSICVVGSDIYIGGAFTSVGGIPANNIAKWNGTAWTALGSGVTTPYSYPAIQALAYDGTYLYAGGYFTNAGGSSINWLAKWDGSAWSAVGESLNEAVYDIEVYGDKVFVCGVFSLAGSQTVSYIAEFNGGAWHPMGSGLSAWCRDMTLDGSTLYATGSFSNAGGISAAYIAKWNGSTWSALGTGFNNTGRALKFHNGKLYAGGEFTIAGNRGANKVAVWDGTSWSGLGSGLYTTQYIDAVVETIEAYGSDIYVGGSFLTAGGLSSKNLAKWSGTSWVTMGTGVEDTVRALSIQTATGSMIYGGEFLASNGNVYTQRIAKFTDSDNPLPVELVSFSGSLKNAAIHLNWQTATEIDNYGFEVERKTVKSDWMKIGFIDGHGTSNSPKYYSFSDNSVMSGEKYLYRLKQIDGDGSFTYSNIIEISASAITGYTLEQNYPNPFSAGSLSGNPETVIRFALPVAGDVKLEVFDIQGGKVATIAEGFHEVGVHSLKFNAENLSTGVYFYTLRQNGRSITRKLVLTK